MDNRNLSRRSFLQKTALGAAAVTVSPILGFPGRGLSTASASPGGGGTPGKFMIILNLLGGNDGLNMVVPTSLAAYRSQRPQINLIDNLPAGETLHDLDGSNALHYSMSGIKALWDAGDVHVINQVVYPNPNKSHFTSQDIYSFGVRDYVFAADRRGWLGRFADCYWSSPSDPLGVISVGLSKRPDFRSDVTSPLILGNVGGFSIDEDNNFPADSILREAVARDILNTEVEPTKEPHRSIFNVTRETYPLVDQVQADTAGWTDPGTWSTTSSISSYMKTIYSCCGLNSSWGTQVFYTGFGGFDTHSGQHSETGGQNRHEGLFTNLDDAISGFAADMMAKGMWDDCVILVMTEFGRRNFENGSVGTDHGVGSTMLAIGGGVNLGYTGQLSEADVLANDMPWSYDFRDIYGHVVQNHLGLDPAPLFPDPGYTPNWGAVGLV